MTPTRLLTKSALVLGFAWCMALTSVSAAPPVRIGGEPAPLADKDRTSLELRSVDYPLADVAELRLPLIETTRLDAVRARNAEPGVKALQIGVERIFRDESTLDASPALNWLPANGGSAARLAVSSPGAAAVRIGLKILGLPKGAELRFVGDGQSSSVVDAVSAAEISAQLADGLYWTPVTEGERQTIEIYLPAGKAAAEVQLIVARVAHLLASPYGSLKGLKIGESDFCEIDANCISNPSAAYINAKNAVARMSYQKNGGSFLCSGTLLNDTVASSFVPYFFSANHCIDNQTVASTLTTFWFEESTSCSSGVASNRVQVSGGATLLFNDAATDALLVRLNNAAPSGAWFTGWDSSAVTAGTNITVLHHPAGDVKKVTLGQITGFGPYNGAGSFIRAGYTNGTTEQGSSGSGILTFASNQYVLRGGLFGGSASCANTGNIANPGNTDAFSRFDVVFPSLQQFLAPSAPPPTQQLQNGVPVTGLSAATNATLSYTVAIPSGATNLVISTAGGTGDADLYVRFGSAPTLSVFDCRSFNDANTEQCSFPTPSAGTYHVLINGFSAFSGVTLSASWQSGGGGGVGVDEPGFTAFPLPIPNPAFANCPAGYFTATVEDGPGAGLTPGLFGLALQLDSPGTQRLDGGLNFGGLVDGSQAAFAGFAFQNSANELQTINLTLLGRPTSNGNGSLPVRVKIIRQAPNVPDVLVLETTATLSMAQSVVRSINLAPAYYVATVIPEGAAAVSGGAADGEVFVGLNTQFVDRPGGGFFAGVVIGGYHAVNPFGSVSAFGAICIGLQHSATARVLSRPTYGIAGARDLRLRLKDFQGREIIVVP